MPKVLTFYEPYKGPKREAKIPGPRCELQLMYTIRVDLLDQQWGSLNRSPMRSLRVLHGVPI